jgi:AraC family ethanolamine operon transcriptional activator
VQHPNQLKALELDIRDRVLALILSAKGHSKLSLSARQAVFYQAVEHIMAHQDDLSLSMPHLAEQVNVSLRTLEYAFHDTLGHPPRGFIRRLRLQSLRRQLLLNSSCRGVTDAAARAGFVELGRMANDYKKSFGELPSQTLARAITVQLPGSIQRTHSSSAR